MTKLFDSGLEIFDTIAELTTIMVIMAILLIITMPILVMALFLGTIKRLTGLEV